MPTATRQARQRAEWKSVPGIRSTGNCSPTPGAAASVSGRLIRGSPPSRYGLPNATPAILMSNESVNVAMASIKSRAALLRRPAGSLSAIDAEWSMTRTTSAATGDSPRTCAGMARSTAATAAAATATRMATARGRDRASLRSGGRKRPPLLAAPAKHIVDSPVPVLGRLRLVHRRNILVKQAPHGLILAVRRLPALDPPPAGDERPLHAGQHGLVDLGPLGPLHGSSTRLYELA